MWTLTEAQICGKRVRPRRLPRPRRFWRVWEMGWRRGGDGAAAGAGGPASGWSAGVFQRTVMILVTWAAGLAACGRDNFRNPCGTRSGSHPRPGQQRHRVGTQSRFPCSSRRLPTAKGDVCRPPRICGAPFHLLGKNDRFPPENSGGKSFEPCPDPNPAAHAETRGAAAGPSAGAQRAMRASATRARRPPFARPRHESGLPSSCRISFRF